MKGLGGHGVSSQVKGLDAPQALTMDQNVCNTTSLMKANEQVVESVVRSMPVFMSVFLMYTVGLGMSSGEDAVVLWPMNI